MGARLIYEIGVDRFECVCGCCSRLALSYFRVPSVCRTFIRVGYCVALKNLFRSRGQAFRTFRTEYRENSEYWDMYV